MENMISVEDFTVEKQCEFKERLYIVRDNGAVMRLPKEGCRASGYDNRWTFGKKDSSTGYMMVSGVRVHQIVATAFHGAPAEKTMVVDHKDTNRCNNRPENLAWVTRFRDKLRDPNVSWMCTVSKEEAANCKQNLERWAADDNKKKPTGQGLGDWIYGTVGSGADSGFGESWDKDWYKREPRKSDYHIQMEAIKAENRIISILTTLKKVRYSAAMTSISHTHIKPNCLMISQFLR